VSKQGKPKALGLMAVVILGLGGGATYFQYQSVQRAKADVAALEGQVPSQKELQKSLSDSHQKLTEYQSKLAHLESSVPDVAYIPTLLKELETLGNGHGIKVTGVRPAPQAFMQPAAPMEEGKKAKKKEYEEIEIEVKGRGRYEHVKAFLDALQTFPKVLAVKTVSMTPMRESGSGRTSEIEATINVVAYVFPFEMLTAEVPAGVGSNSQPSQPPVVTGQPGDVQPTTPTSSSSSSMTETHKVAKTGGRK
jgi:Tfp pilus assembly protein PilO